MRQSSTTRSPLSDTGPDFWAPASWNHGITIDWVGRVGKNLKDFLVSIILLWTGITSCRSGCSEPNPTSCWALPGMRHPLLLQALCCGSSPLSQKRFFPNIWSKPIFSHFESIPSCPVAICTYSLRKFCAHLVWPEPRDALEKHNKQDTRQLQIKEVWGSKDENESYRGL